MLRLIETDATGEMLVGVFQPATFDSPGRWES